jgi:ubiquinone biosynthesis protein
MAIRTPETCSSTPGGISAFSISVSSEDQENLREMVLAIITRDAEALAELYLGMGVVPPDIDRDAFTRELGKAIESYYAVSARAYSFGEILRQFVRLGQRHRIRLPREWLLVLKSFMVTESQARALDETFSMLRAIEDYTPHMLKAGLVPDLSGTSALVRSYRLLALARTIAGTPAMLMKTLQRFERGEATVRIRHERLDEIERHFDHASNRLSFSLIIGSVLIASSMVMGYRIGPHLGDIPLLGLAGYGMAAVLGLAWAIAILRSGRL